MLVQHGAYLRRVITHATMRSTKPEIYAARNSWFIELFQRAAFPALLASIVPRIVFLFMNF